MLDLLSRKHLFQPLVFVSFSVAMFVGGGQGQATASTPMPNIAYSSSAQSPVFPPHGLSPTLPPLDNPGIFLPKVEQEVRLVLKLGQRRVYVYKGEETIASYPVAVGKAGWETPTGNFKVIQMIENPSWQNPWTGEVRPPGPNSALGLRWIGFWTDGKDTIGFHGTPTINSIGQAASHGCVRMRNEDIVALFEKVTMGTTVLVEP